MDEIKERKLQIIREDIDSLVMRLNRIERDEIENENWKEEIHSFIEANDISGTITIAVDVSASMTEDRDLAHLLVGEIISYNTRNKSLICFTDEIEVFTKYLQTSPMKSILFGGSGDLLQLLNWIVKNRLDNPLIIFSDGILYPTEAIELTQLKALLKDFSYPVLWIYPNKRDYKDNIHQVNRVLDYLKIAFMTE